MSKFVEDLAKRLDVPYLVERDRERLLGHRLREISDEEALKQGLFPTRRFRSPTGEILETDEFPTMDHDQLTEEVWTRENWPTDPNNTVLEALQKVPRGITAMYYHMTTLNLVLVTPEGDLIGIRRTALYDKDEVKALDRLKKAFIS
jgi:hypothetical protein